MELENKKIIPPGQHPQDPSNTDVDPVGYALDRLQSYLFWCDEHRASYEKVRNESPDEADNEMACLKQAIEGAILHLQRLTELILAGYGVDSEKHLPKNLCGEGWKRLVHHLSRDGLGEVNGP